MKYLLMILIATPCYGADVTLKWDRNDPAEKVTGYKLYYGVDDFSNVIDVGNNTTWTLDIPEGIEYKFVATAYIESGHSNEVRHTIQKPITCLGCMGGK